MTVATETIEFVQVVDAEGNQIQGFTAPVPSHWIGTDLLPEGAKKAPKHREEDADASGDVEALQARVADLEAENATLREHLAAATDAGKGEAIEPPAGNASQGTWEAYARSLGATDADLDGLSRDELREKYGPKG